jgi:hypothetical protein
MTNVNDAIPVAGNGLLDRRLLMRGGGVFAALAVTPPAGATPLTVPEWMTYPGAPVSPYGQPSSFENHVARTPFSAGAFTATGPGATRTPLQFLEGMITPNGLFFERIHNGIPDIDPAQHRLLIHGLIRRPLTFSLETLARYPMESRIAFVECSGNSGAMFAKEPAGGGAAGIHGLVSCAEWTGIRLSHLLDEAGVDPKAQWVLAEGADAAAMSRSVPIAKAMDDALIALYRRAHPPFQWLSDAPAAAGLRRQYERQMAAPPEVGAGTDHDQGRDVEVLAAAEGRPGRAVRVRDGREIGHHPSLARLEPHHARPLRDFRPRLVGTWKNHPGRSLGRWRRLVGRRRLVRTRAVHGADAVPRAMEVVGRARETDQPRHRRYWNDSAEPREAVGNARTQKRLSLQRHHVLERGNLGRGRSCVCLEAR